MIAHLRGMLDSIEEDHIIVDINGIGFKVFIPLSTYYQLPEPGEEVEIYTYHHIREDTWALYGFFNQEQLALFELLLSVSKIGPKVALNIVSNISVPDFKIAVLSENVNLLGSVPGIGSKTANRLILELRDKLDALPVEIEAEAIRRGRGIDEQVLADATAALVTLGYSSSAVRKAINRIKSEVKSDIRVEELIRRALRVLV